MYCFRMMPFKEACQLGSVYKTEAQEKQKRKKYQLEIDKQ